ncbi:MAG: hypothetical protein HZB26_15615 [Candidatus Hydrogenedentes bacterium]|nr:hypothetical protein [Candidatus Hydrogenedentota bacterium]
MQITETGRITSTMVLEPAKYDLYTLDDYWDSYTAKMLLTGLAPRPTKTEPQDWGWFDGLRYIAGQGQEISCEDEGLHPALKRYGQISDLLDVNASPQQDWRVSIQDGPIPPPFIKPQYFVRPREFVKWTVLHEIAVPEPLLPLITPILDKDLKVHHVVFDVAAAGLNDFFSFAFYRYFPSSETQPNTETRKLNPGGEGMRIKAQSNNALIENGVIWVLKNCRSECVSPKSSEVQATYVRIAIKKHFVEIYPKDDAKPKMNHTTPRRTEDVIRDILKKYRQR